MEDITSKDCQIDTDKQVNRLEAISMENDLLKVTILPGFGAKLFEFIYKPAGRDFLYHNPRCKPRQPVYGANIDNWWSGGMDEAIPTGHACIYRNEELPYLGEVWSQAWEWEITCCTPEKVEIHLTCDTIIAPLRVERWLSLSRGDSFLIMRHKVTNTGYGSTDFLWGIHPAFAIQPGFRIDLPARTVWVAESSPANHLGERGSTYQWPYVTAADGSILDMRVIPEPLVGWHELHHAIELDAGWLALTDPVAKVGIALTFSTQVFDTIWLWLVYGGWRDLYAAAFEAWNGYPAKLTDALQQGRCSHLAPGATLETETRLTVFTGLTSVDAITPEGKILGA